MKKLWWIVFGLALLALIISGGFNLLEEERTGQFVRGTVLVSGLILAGLALLKSYWASQLDYEIKELKLLETGQKKRYRKLLAKAGENESLLLLVLDTTVELWNNIKPPTIPELKMVGDKVVWAQGLHQDRQLLLVETVLMALIGRQPSLIQADELAHQELARQQTKPLN